MRKTILIILLLLAVSNAWGEDKELIKKYQSKLEYDVDIARDEFVYISNEYRKDDPQYKKGNNHYYVQYFAGGHTIMALRRDKSLPDLLDEIVADIKKQDYGIEVPK